jgi:hypothetical protein
MDKKLKEKERIIDGSEINDANGLNISYNKSDLEKHFPNLTSEIKQSKQQISIDAVRTNKELKSDLLENYKEDISNPGIFDFIRRCRSKDEALEILNYLLKRKEITNELHDHIQQLLLQEDGLSILLNRIGGYKEPGYYQKKYYKNI